MRLSEQALAHVEPRPFLVVSSSELRLSVDPRPRRARYVLERCEEGEWRVVGRSPWLPKLFGLSPVEFRDKAGSILPGAESLEFKADDLGKGVRPQRRRPKA